MPVQRLVNLLLMYMGGTVKIILMTVKIVLSDGTFEALDITDLSTPPDLPEVMKPQDSTSHIAD